MGARRSSETRPRCSRGHERGIRQRRAARSQWPRADRRSRAVPTAPGPDRSGCGCPFADPPRPGGMSWDARAKTLRCPCRDPARIPLELPTVCKCIRSHARPVGGGHVLISSTAFRTCGMAMPVPSPDQRWSTLAAGGETPPAIRRFGARPAMVRRNDRERRHERGLRESSRQNREVSAHPLAARASDMTRGPRELLALDSLVTSQSCGAPAHLPALVCRP